MAITDSLSTKIPTYLASQTTASDLPAHCEQLLESHPLFLIETKKAGFSPAFLAYCFTIMPWKMVLHGHNGGLDLDTLGVGTSMQEPLM
jgi:hypothetical protein